MIEPPINPPVDESEPDDGDEDVPQDGVCYWGGCEKPPVYGSFFCEDHGDD